MRAAVAHHGIAFCVGENQADYALCRDIAPARHVHGSGAHDEVLGALPSVDRHFAAQVEKLKLPGLAVSVVIGGKLVYEKGFGVVDTESKAAVDADSVFAIGSISKSFTAAAILKLRDEGKLSLDDLVAKHVPELANLMYPTRDSAPITVRQLLSHGPGFPEDRLEAIDSSACLRRILRRCSLRGSLSRTRRTRRTSIQIPGSGYSVVS